MSAVRLRVHRCNLMVRMMDLAVCGAGDWRVVITEHALVSLDVRDPSFAASSEVVARLRYGAIPGGQSGVLDLRDAQPVPRLSDLKRVVTCRASELPQELTETPGWPHFRWDVWPVVCFPRTLIDEVAVRWTGRLRIAVAGVPDTVLRISMLDVGKAREAFRRWSYSLR